MTKFPGIGKLNAEIREKVVRLGYGSNDFSRQIRPRSGQCFRKVTFYELPETG